MPDAGNHNSPKLERKGPPPIPEQARKKIIAPETLEDTQQDIGVPDFVKSTFADNSLELETHDGDDKMELQTAEQKAPEARKVVPPPLPAAAARAQRKIVPPPLPKTTSLKKSAESEDISLEALTARSKETKEKGAEVEQRLLAELEESKKQDLLVEGVPHMAIDLEQKKILIEDNNGNPVYLNIGKQLNQGGFGRIFRVSRPMGFDAEGKPRFAYYALKENKENTDQALASLRREVQVMHLMKDVKGTVPVTAACSKDGDIYPEKAFQKEGQHFVLMPDVGISVDKFAQNIFYEIADEFAPELADKTRRLEELKKPETDEDVAEKDALLVWMEDHREKYMGKVREELIRPREFAQIPEAKNYLHFLILLIKQSGYIESLKALQSKGLVNHDIKPDNIMIDTTEEKQPATIANGQYASTQIDFGGVEISGQKYRGIATESPLYMSIGRLLRPGKVTYDDVGNVVHYDLPPEHRKLFDVMEYDYEIDTAVDSVTLSASLLAVLTQLAGGSRDCILTVRNLEYNAHTRPGVETPPFQAFATTDEPGFVYSEVLRKGIKNLQTGDGQSVFPASPFDAQKLCASVTQDANGNYEPGCRALMRGLADGTQTFKDFNDARRYPIDDIFADFEAYAQDATVDRLTDMAVFVRSFNKNAYIFADSFKEKYADTKKSQELMRRLDDTSSETITLEDLLE